MAVHKANGKPTRSEEETIDRWREHYSLMLNRLPADPYAEMDLLHDSSPLCPRSAMPKVRYSQGPL